MYAERADEPKVDSPLRGTAMHIHRYANCKWAHSVSSMLTKLKDSSFSWVRIEKDSSNVASAAFVVHDLFCLRLPAVSTGH